MTEREERDVENHLDRCASLIDRKGDGNRFPDTVAVETELEVGCEDQS